MADEEEGESCVHNVPICDSQKKAENHHSVVGRFACVYDNLSDVLGFLGCCEDMGRNTKEWIAIVTTDFLQSGAFHKKQDFDSKIGEPRTMGQLSGKFFFFCQFVPAPWPV